MLDLLLGDSEPSEQEVVGAFRRFADRTLRFYYLNGEKDSVLEEDELVQVVDIAWRYILNYKGPSGFKVAAAFTVSWPAESRLRRPCQNCLTPSEQSRISFSAF